MPNAEIISFQLVAYKKLALTVKIMKMYSLSAVILRLLKLTGEL